MDKYYEESTVKSIEGYDDNSDAESAKNNGEIV